MRKTALVTGITGQDGAYLAELLLGRGYEVVGAYRRSSTFSPWRLQNLGILGHKNLNLQEMELTDPSSIFRTIASKNFDEIYNLGAQSFVSSSFLNPSATAEMTGTAVAVLLEAIRTSSPDSRFYQASTSEMFGKVQQVPQTELTPFYPRSPYGAAKLFAHWITVNYRESYNIFASSGILFNHESPLRGLEFVTRKITDGVARIKLKKQKSISLGNLDAKRDWGHARDYVGGMWAILQADNPDTFVLATGRTETVREFARLAFKAAEIEIEFEGTAEDEIARDVATGQTVIQVDPQFYRPAEVDLLIGDASKARLELGWHPKTTLEELCSEMVQADIQRLSR